MVISCEEMFFQKIKIFDRTMIEAIKSNKEMFKFEDEQYDIYSNGIFVQTLINDRILYRIFIDECRNDASVHYDLLKYLQH